MPFLVENTLPLLRAAIGEKLRGEYLLALQAGDRSGGRLAVLLGAPRWGRYGWNRLRVGRGCRAFSHGLSFATGLRRLRVTPRRVRRALSPVAAAPRPCSCRARTVVSHAWPSARAPRRPRRSARARRLKVWRLRLNLTAARLGCGVQTPASVTRPERLRLSRAIGSPGSGRRARAPISFKRQSCAEEAIRSVFRFPFSRFLIVSALSVDQALER